MRLGLSMLAPPTSSAPAAPQLPDAFSLGPSRHWPDLDGVSRQLSAPLSDTGIHFEWHHIQSPRPFDWSGCFHPERVAISLNLSGDGVVQAGQGKTEFDSASALLCWTGQENGIRAERVGGQKHDFLTIEFSPQFLAASFTHKTPGLNPLVAAALAGKAKCNVSPAIRLTTQHRELIGNLSRPPVFRLAQPVWYQAKALEVAALFFFEPPAEQELFCRRQQHLAQERVEKVRKLLQESLAEPPTLEEIAKRVGCSPFYLSRTFSKETGTTIPQYLRRIRMERAAELLKSGRFNVTEAAMEVGYSSLSHFSQAFHETFGCCPGLYPIFPKGATRPIPGQH